MKVAIFRLDVMAYSLGWTDGWLADRLPDFDASERASTQLAVSRS